MTRRVVGVVDGCEVVQILAASLTRSNCDFLYCSSLLLSWRPLLCNDLVAIELVCVSCLLSPFVPRRTEIPALEIWLLILLLVSFESKTTSTEF